MSEVVILADGKNPIDMVEDVIRLHLQDKSYRYAKDLPIRVPEDDRALPCVCAQHKNIQNVIPNCPEQIQ